MISPITIDSLSRAPEASVAVCAYDAGAASHMAAWLAPLLSKLRLCLAGPAEAIFNAQFGASVINQQNLEKTLNGATVLISGTGWASDLEHQARLLARQRGIPSVAVLDHWVNYRQRFRRDGQELLPDHLWVSDEEAASLARKTFPGLPVMQLSNQWLDGVCMAVETIRCSGVRQQPLQARRPGKRLLYLLEPIRVSWLVVEGQSPDNTSEAGEFQALRYWLQQLPHLIQQGWVAPQHELEALALRPHPSDPASKYDNLIAEFSAEWPIRLDAAPRLAEALAWADAAFGCETQALVAAMACNLPAFSTVPPWAPLCRLPHAGLHHLSQLEGV